MKREVRFDRQVNHFERQRVLSKVVGQYSQGNLTPEETAAILGAIGVSRDESRDPFFYSGRDIDAALESLKGQIDEATRNQLRTSFGIG